MENYRKLYSEAKQAKAVRQITPQFVRWEKPGQQIIGAYVSYNQVKSRLADSTYNQYLFDTDDGLVKFSLGHVADGDVSSLFSKGTVYAITYLGKDKIPGGRSVNRFNIEEIGIVDELPFPGPEEEEEEEEEEGEEAKVKAGKK
jgi:hypothetical protein